MNWKEGVGVVVIVAVAMGVGAHVGFVDGQRAGAVNQIEKCIEKVFETDGALFADLPPPMFDAVVNEITAVCKGEARQ